MKFPFSWHLFRGHWFVFGGGFLVAETKSCLAVSSHPSWTGDILLMVQKGDTKKTQF